MSNGAEPVQATDVETLAAMHGFFSAADVGWLRDVDGQTVDIWMETAASENPDELEHWDHAPVDPDPWNASVDGFCLACLPGTLAIAEADQWLLLNPRVVDADGEWECWHFASWIPGAWRYRSFRAYLEECAQQLDASAVGVADPYVLAAQAARDESLPTHKRLEAISKVTYGPRPEQAVEPALAMLTASGGSNPPIKNLGYLLQHGYGEEAIVKALIPLCAVPVRADRVRVFEDAVCALALSRRSEAIAAVKAALRDVDSVHSATLQELLNPADPLEYAEEWWHLWEATGDPAYLLKLGWAGDQRAIAQIRQVVADPKDYRPARGAFRGGAGDMTFMRMTHLLGNLPS